MLDSDLNRLTPQRGGFGENVARTLRLLSKLLLAWGQRQTGEDRAEEYNLPEGDAGLSTEALQIESTAVLTRRNIALQAICFDKLGMFFLRTWNELHRRKLVRTTVALEKKRGFHGPGPALRINRKSDEQHSLGRQPGDYRESPFAYATEVVEKLKPTFTGARSLFKVDRSSSDIHCKVYSQIDETQWALWITDPDFLTPSELECMNQICDAVSCLNANEIRAMGTHCSPVETVGDIRFNLIRWRQSLDKVLAFLDGDTKITVTRGVDEMVNISREILRKSKTNRSCYARARKKLKERISPGVVRAAVLETHLPAENIWDDVGVTFFAAKAASLIDLSCYCRAGLIELNAGRRLGQKETEEARESYQRLTTCNADNGAACRLCAYVEIQQLGPNAWAEQIREFAASVFPSVVAASHQSITFGG